MTEEEITEPTNKQLANFMFVLAKGDPRAEGLNINADVLERIFEQDPKWRAYALRRHQEFAQNIHELTDKMQRGQLQCAHIRTNGRNCPNWNEPGSFYCGLHKEQEEPATV